MRVSDDIKMSGHFKVEVFNEDGSLDQVGEGGNIMCTNGYGALANAIAWSMAFDQNTTLGITLTPVYAGPMYGAVGQATGNPAAADSTLFSELARSTLYSILVNGQVITVSFFYGVSTNNWQITEAGVFLNATSTGGSGSLLDHALISPAVSKSTTQTATLSVVFTFS